VLGNHDRPRIAARVGSAQARIAAMLLLTLRGTPTIYYGDEIGLEQAPIPPGRIRDPLARNVPGLNLGRDGARTPMQWSAKLNAGFSSSEPWLPLTADSRNVEILSRDSRSIYGLYRRLVETRRHSEALKRGSYHPIAAKGDMLIYVRAFDTDRILIMLNLGATPVVSTSNAFKGIVLVSASGKHEGDFVDQNTQLDANEGLVIKLALDVDISH
jgi:alpha-glucosidase